MPRSARQFWPRSDSRQAVATSSTHWFAPLMPQIFVGTSGWEDASASQSRSVAVRRLVAASSWGRPLVST